MTITKNAASDRGALSSRTSSDASSSPASSERGAFGTAASPADVLFLFSGSFRRLEVVEESGAVVEFMAHEGVLCKLPYFAGREGAWRACDEKAEQLYLPPSCTHSSFGALLSRLYCLDFHWSPADWARVLGAEIASALGALLLAKMLLAVELVEELLAVVHKLASEPDNLQWLQEIVSGLHLPELDELCASSGFAVMDAEALKDAALSALMGPSSSHPLFKALLTCNGITQLGKEGVQSLVSVLQGHEKYATRGRSRCLGYAWSYYRPPVDIGIRYPRYHEFFRPIRIPVEGFGVLWQLILDEVQREPALFLTVFAVFRSLQWLDYDVSANRHGQESHTGSRRLRYQLDAASKQAIRRAYASFLLLGLRLHDRGGLSIDQFMKALACGTLTSAQAPEGSRGDRQRNLLYFVPGARQAVINYVDGIDLLADIISDANDDIRESILLMFLPVFAESQWAFSARLVRALSVTHQMKCIEKCSKSWLTSEVCAALQGEARLAARRRLAANVGRLSKGQRDFLWGGVEQSCGN